MLRGVASRLVLGLGAACSVVAGRCAAGCGGSRIVRAGEVRGCARGAGECDCLGSGIGSVSARLSHTRPPWKNCAEEGTPKPQSRHGVRHVDSGRVRAEGAYPKKAGEEQRCTQEIKPWAPPSMFAPGPGRGVHGGRWGGVLPRGMGAEGAPMPWTRIAAQGRIHGGTQRPLPPHPRLTMLGL